MSELERSDWLEEPSAQAPEERISVRRPLPQMRAWQERILNVLLISTSVLGLFAVISAFTLLIPERLWTGVIVVTLAYALFPLLTVLRRIPGAIRAVVFLVMFYFLGTIALVQGALSGPGRLLILALPLIAFVLLGRVAGLVAAGVSLLTQIVIGWLIASGTLPVLVQIDPTKAASWYSAIAIWVLVEVIILFPVGYLVNNLLVNLDQALGEAQRRWRELSQLSRTLERQVAERTEELARRSAKLEASLQVSRDAAAIREVDRLLDETVRLISERFGFYHAGIFLLDENREYAVLRAASSEGGRRMLARGHRLRVGQVGIVGFVAGAGQPRIALDVGEDAVFFDNPDLPHTRSEMGLPLRVRGEVIGVLDVQSTEGGAFTGEDVTILQTMADQLALALENARLLEESQRALDELRVLYGEYARRAWERLGEVPAFEYDRVQVAPVPPRTDPLLQQVLRSGQVVAHANAEEGHAALVAPLRLGEQVIGAIALEEAQADRVWSEDEIELVQAVSEQVARALESARLYQMEQERRRIADALRDMSRVVSSTLDLQQVIDRLLDQLGRLIPFDTASVQLFHGERRELIGGRGFDVAAARAHVDLLRPLSEDPLLTEVVARRAPLVLPDTHADPRWEIRQDTIKVRSWLAAPLLVGEEVLGVLLIDHHIPNLYNEETGELAGTVAAQAAVAIQNARFFAEARQAAEEQERLAHVASIASSIIDLDELLSQLVEEARKLVNAETMVLMLLREEENALVGSYISRAGHLEPLPAEWRIPLDTPGFEMSIFSRRGAYYSNLGLQDPNVIPAYLPYMEALNARNFCGVALLLRDQSIGELYAVNREGGMSRNEVRLMRTVTGYVANAIDSARKFRETARRAEIESKITEITTRIRASTTMEAIARAAAEELSQALGVARVLVHLGVEAGPAAAPEPVAAEGLRQVEGGDDGDAIA